MILYESRVAGDVKVIEIKATHPSRRSGFQRIDTGESKTDTCKLNSLGDVVL